MNVCPDCQTRFASSEPACPNCAGASASTGSSEANKAARTLLARPGELFSPDQLEELHEPTVLGFERRDTSVTPSFGIVKRPTISRKRRRRYTPSSVAIVGGRRSELSASAETAAGPIGGFAVLRRPQTGPRPALPAKRGTRLRRALTPSSSASISGLRFSKLQGITLTDDTGLAGLSAMLASPSAPPPNANDLTLDPTGSDGSRAPCASFEDHRTALSDSEQGSVKVKPAAAKSYSVPDSNADDDPNERFAAVGASAAVASAPTAVESARHTPVDGVFVDVPEPTGPTFPHPDFDLEFGLSGEANSHGVGGVLETGMTGQASTRGTAIPLDSPGSLALPRGQGAIGAAPVNGSGSEHRSPVPQIGDFGLAASVFAGFDEVDPDAVEPTERDLESAARFIAETRQRDAGEAGEAGEAESESEPQDMSVSMLANDLKTRAILNLLHADEEEEVLSLDIEEFEDADPDLMDEEVVSELQLSLAPAMDSAVMETPTPSPEAEPPGRDLPWDATAAGRQIAGTGVRANGVAADRPLDPPRPVNPDVMLAPPNNGRGGMFFGLVLAFAAGVALTWFATTMMG